MVDQWPLERALRWSGILLTASCLLPLRAGDDTLWSWGVAGPSAILGVVAPLVGGVGLIALSRSALSSLVKAGAAGFLVLTAAWLASANAETAAGLLFGLPPQMRALGWLLVPMLICAGAASRWRTAAPEDMRAVRVLIASCGVAMGLLLLWPAQGRPFLVTLARGLWEMIATDTGVPLTSLIVNFQLAVMPMTVAAIVCILALLSPVSRAVWVVAVPSTVMVLWAAKIATETNADGVFGVGLRGALVLGAQVMAGIWVVAAAAESRRVAGGEQHEQQRAERTSPSAG